MASSKRRPVGINPKCVATWLGLLLLLPVAVRTKPALYNSRFNKTCKYAAYNVSKALFTDGLGGGFAYIMPLESNMAVNDYVQPWRACFNASEPVDMKLLHAGKKLPCFYKQNQWGNFDFWEENACDILIRSNCYCYAVNKYVGSYCEPGLGSTGKPFPLPVTDCTAAVQGVIADGGRLVDRVTVYNQESSGHYIALAVKPSQSPSDTGDFHFWRLDENNTWSYKAGDTLSRNTFRNGTVLRDIEAPEARGAYVNFCGYFEVWPNTHKLVGNSYYFSNLPARLKLWRDVAVKDSVVTLDSISPGWLAAYRKYFADAGWEDGIPIRKEAARAPMPRAGGQHPHTYSVRPFSTAVVAESSSASSPGAPAAAVISGLTRKGML